MGRRRAAASRRPRRPIETELVGYRQVFETWWIGVPVGFEECWVSEGGYWHAWDAHRSVSMSSTILADEAGDPAPAAEVMDGLGDLLQGEPIAEVPGRLLARATIIRTDPGARASRAVTGVVVVDGRVLITTITSDDIDWATQVWQSIGYRAVPIGPGPRAAATVLD